ncbi:hypothetical protein E3E37_03410 [Thermococcus sp. ES12]|nr:hypothetical protein [Thermococcus sp. ES12]
MARDLGIKRQTMNEYFHRIILPLADRGIFVVKPYSTRWGDPRYFIWLAPGWREALCKWILEEVGG